MNALPYPRNAQAIVAARANGMKPAGPVLVALTQQYRPLPADAIVYADTAKTYRWDWVRSLRSVVVLIDAKATLGSVLADIEAHEPNQIDVVDIERRKGWLVCFASPQLRTVKWPQPVVDDWLGDGSMHLEIQRLTAEGLERAAKEKARWI